MLQTIEAAIAAIVILAGLFAFGEYAEPQIDTQPAQDMLAAMDAAGELRPLAYGWKAQDIYESLSGEIKYNMRVELIGSKEIAYGGQPGGHSATVSYYLAGYTGFEPMEVRVAIW